MRRDSLPYWLAGATEACGLCVGAHVLEMQRRSACDRGCCVDCVGGIRAPREILSAECHDHQGVG